MPAHQSIAMAMRDAFMELLISWDDAFASIVSESSIPTTMLVFVIVSTSVLVGVCFERRRGYTKASSFGELNVIAKKRSKKDRRRAAGKSTEWIQCEVVCCKDENNYRRAISKHVLPSDRILELGCHVGVTTNLLAAAGKEAFGIDSSEYSITTAKQRFGDRSNLFFFQADAIDIRNSNKLLSGPIDVVFIDLSGNREPGLILQTLEAYDRVFKPRLFVIKNFKLQNFVMQTISCE